MSSGESFSDGAREAFDYVIIGGGTAGCAVASRVSEMPDVRVLLLEAGPDMHPDEVPSATLDTFPSNYDIPGYRWAGMDGHNLNAWDSPSRRLHQASVIGGGSTIMGMMALRGIPDDYDEWRALGAAGWGWDDVLPFFRKLETDIDGSEPLHGTDGPVVIRRTPLSAWSPVALQARRHAMLKEMNWIEDLNGDFRDGYGALPRFATKDRRQSSALCYLTASVRARHNLTILGGAKATELVFDGQHVRAVIADVQGERRAFSCRDLVLSGGALLTPELLLRHGIGPAAQLRALGLKVRADLPVGQNLQNHAQLQFVSLLRSPGATAGQERAHSHGLFRLSPDEAPEGRAAIAISSGGPAGQHAMARRMANFSVLLMKPESRGQITLTGPRLDRLIEYRLLDADADARRIGMGCDFLLSLIQSSSMQSLVGTPRLVTNWDRVVKINRPGTGNMILTTLAGTVAHLIPTIGDRFLDLIGTRLKPGTPITLALAPAILPAGHHSGTCRMGPREDGGVVDVEGRLHGFRNIRVVDASVMPTVPRGNTNLPVLMVAEKISDAIRRFEKSGLAA